MKTRVSLALAGLGITALRPGGAAVDLLLTANPEKQPHAHKHIVTLSVPKRHFGGATIEGRETSNHIVFTLERRDIRLIGMPAGPVAVTRGLRKEIGEGKRQETPDALDDWRDVTWAVDFDHTEEKPSLIPNCFSSKPPIEVAARVHMTGGRLEAGVPRHFCLRSERWLLLNAEGFPADQQNIADTMYHVWDTETSEVTVKIEHFSGALDAAISLLAVGGVIAGVVIQSRPKEVADNKKCGEGEIDHYEMLYGIVDAHPGSIAIVQDQSVVPVIPGFKVDESKRCGRGVISA